MSITGARSPRWVFELLNSADEPIRVLDGVTGGGCEVSATTRLGGSADLSIVETGQGIDWMSHRVSVSYDPGTGDAAWDVGVYMSTSPKEEHDGFNTVYDVSLLSKMAVVDEDTVETRFSVAAGANIIDTVMDLLDSTGETRVAVTESDKVLAGPMSHDPATSKLTIINDLLSAAGYWGLWLSLIHI